MFRLSGENQTSHNQNKQEISPSWNGVKAKLMLSAVVSPWLSGYGYSVAAKTKVVPGTLHNKHWQTDKVKDIYLWRFCSLNEWV